MQIGATLSPAEPGAATAEATTAAVRAAGRPGTAEHAGEDVLEALATRPGGRVAHPRPTAGSSGAATEHAGEDVLEAAGSARSSGTAREAGTPGGHGAQAVVLLPLPRVGQDRVGLADLLEACLGRRVTRVLVRMVGARELAVRLLDGGLVGVLRHPEDRVEVLLEPVLATAHGRLLPGVSACLTPLLTPVLPPRRGRVG